MNTVFSVFVKLTIQDHIKGVQRSFLGGGFFLFSFLVNEKCKVLTPPKFVTNMCYIQITTHAPYPFYCTQ